MNPNEAYLILCNPNSTLTSPAERTTLLTAITQSAAWSYHTLRDTTNGTLTAPERTALLDTITHSAEYSYRTLRDTTITLTPTDRAPLLATIAESALYSYYTLRDATHLTLTTTERAPLLTAIAQSADYSYLVLRDTASTHTAPERTALLNALQPQRLTPAQATLMRTVMDIINATPEAWDQGKWHRLCGTAHCFAGHVEGLTHNEWHHGNDTSERAQEALGLTPHMASVLFAGSNSLETLNQYVNHLTNIGETS